MKTPRAPIVITLTLVALVLSACQGAFAPVSQNLDGGPPVDLTGRSGVDPAAPVPDEAGGVTGEGLDAAQADRSIIRTGEITVEVDNVAQTTGAVRALAVELDGYVSSSFQGEFDESATLTMRIPADRFDEALAAIHELDGEVKAEATREEDVTATVVDLEARLTNLRAAEVEYRELLDRAEQIEDILAIQNQLFQVRGEIEAMQAQLDYFNDQAAMATLTVSVIPGAVEQATTDFDPAAIVQEAVAQLVSVGQWLVAAGIWFVIVGLPVLIGLAIVAFVAIRVLRRISPARGTTATPSSEPPATG
ncbi:MAG: DUF4349 domain-containing protein [Candidatus Limnocylindria bacterium]